MALLTEVREAERIARVERTPAMDLDDYRVVITGAGRDFGRSLAIGLAELGAEVFLSARDFDAA